MFESIHDPIYDEDWLYTHQVYPYFQRASLLIVHTLLHQHVILEDHDDESDIRGYKIP